MIDLQSERLDLKALCEEDVSALYDYFSNKDNFPFVQMPIYDTIEEVKSYILIMQAGIDAGKWYLWGIYLKNENKLIGTISLWNFSVDRQTAEFGYGLFPAFRGSGYMAESIRTCLDFAFDSLKIYKIEAYTQKNNQPSLDVLTKLGFDFESSVIEDDEEMAIYAIINRGIRESVIVSYINQQEESIQPTLYQLRETILQVLPGAIEKISYGMPTFWDKHNMIHFAAQKNHFGIYPGPEAIEFFIDELKKYKTSKGAIQFPKNEPLPLQLISKIATWCYQKNNQR